MKEKFNVLPKNNEKKKKKKQKQKKPKERNFSVTTKSQLLYS